MTDRSGGQANSEGSPQLRAEPANRKSSQWVASGDGIHEALDQALRPPVSRDTIAVGIPDSLGTLEVALNGDPEGPIFQHSERYKVLLEFRKHLPDDCAVFSRTSCSER